MTYPNEPGYQDTDTSKAAAADMIPRAGTIAAKVLDALATAPMASFELAAAVNISYRSTQPRTSELRTKRLIRDSGQRKTDPETGKLAIVWELV